MRVEASQVCTTCNDPDVPNLPGPQSFPEPFGLAADENDDELLAVNDAAAGGLMMLKDVSRQIPPSTFKDSSLASDL